MRREADMNRGRHVAGHLTGWVLDLLPARDGMEIWFRTAAGDTVTLFAPFRPSFVVAGRGVREAAVRASAERWRCGLQRGEGTEFFSGRTVRAWTFAVAAPSLLRATVGKAESAFGPEALANADIAPEQQFAYATGLFPFSFAEVECAEDGRILSARVLYSPWDVDMPLPPLSRALLRAEGTGHPAHGRTQPLAFSAGGTTHVLCWEDGAGFLREFLRLLEAADPDLLVTEYGDDYILPRMLALAARLGAPLSLGRTPRPPGEAGGSRPRPARGGGGAGKGGGRGAHLLRGVARGRPKLLPLRGDRPPGPDRTLPPFRHPPAAPGPLVAGDRHLRDAGRGGALAGDPRPLQEAGAGRLQDGDGARRDRQGWAHLPPPARPARKRRRVRLRLDVPVPHGPAQHLPGDDQLPLLLPRPPCPRDWLPHVRPAERAHPPDACPPPL